MGIYFEFFSFPYDRHRNPAAAKGVLFDTNRGYDEDAIWKMMEQSRVAAYGAIKHVVEYLNPKDTVFFCHKWVGVVAAGEVAGPVKQEGTEEEYRDVRFLTPVPKRDVGIVRYMPASDVSRVTGKSFFWTRTIKVPYLKPQVVVASPLEIPLAVTLDVLLDDSGEPVLLPVLALLNPAPQGKRAVAMGKSISDLVIALFRWAVRLSREDGAEPDQITLKDMTELSKRLRAPSGQSVSRWRVLNGAAGKTSALEADVIREFFKLNVKFNVYRPDVVKKQLLQGLDEAAKREVADSPIPGIIMPWLQELKIFSIPSNGQAPRLLRDFASAEKFDEVWEKTLHEKLRKGRPAFHPLDSAQARAKLQNTPVLTKSTKTAVDIMLEDWCASIIEGVVYRASTILREGGLTTKPIPFSKLLAELKPVAPEITEIAPPVVEVAQHASAVLMHALRTPMKDLTSWTSITNLASLDLHWDKTEIQDTDEELNIKASGPNWINGEAFFPFTLRENGKDTPVNAGKIRQEAEKVASEVKGKSVELTIAFDKEKKTRPYVVAFTGGLPFFATGTSPSLGLMFQVPEELAILQAKQQPVGQVPTEARGIYFEEFSTFGQLEKNKATPQLFEEISPENDLAIGGQLNLKLRRLYTQQQVIKTVSGTQTSSDAPPSDVQVKIEKIQGVYGISGAGEVGRLILRSWQEGLRSLAPEKFRLLFNPSGGKVPSSAGSSNQINVLDNGVEFFLTNLSTEANPDTNPVRARLNGDSSVVFDITKPDEVRKFLWQASVVNSEGFYLRINEKTHPDALKRLEDTLANEASLDIALLWTRPAFKKDIGGKPRGRIHPYESCLLVSGNPPADFVVRIGVTKKTDNITPEQQSQAAVPEGFLDLRVERPNPQYALMPSDADDMLAKYAYLEYRIDAKSDPANFIELSFDEGTALPVEAPQNDTTKPLENQQPKNFEHRVLLPLLQFAKENLDSSGKLLATADKLNPYAVVGIPLEKVLRFGLRDAAGHRFPGTVKAKWVDAQSQKPITAKLLYHDAMRALNTYPGMTMGWSIESKNKQALVTLRLQWKIDNAVWSKLDARHRQEILALYRLLHWTLAANGITVTASLNVNGKSLPVSSDVRPELLGFVLGIVTSLELAIESPFAIPEDLNKLVLVSLPYPANSLQTVLSGTAEPQSLGVSIQVERPESLCDKTIVESIPEVKTVQTEVLPDIDKADRDAWFKFSGHFEAAFSTSPMNPTARLLRLVLGSGQGSLWVIGKEVLDVTSTVERAVWSYAPKPLLKTFQSGDAKLLDVDGTSPREEKVRPISDVDLDVLAERALSTIESMLAPDIAAKICQLSPESFKTFMASKRKVVDFYSNRLVRIEAGQNAHDTNPAGDEVKIRFEAAAYQDLREIYRLGAICSVQSDLKIGSGTTRIYGDVNVPQDKQNPDVEFSQLRLPLNATEAGAFSIAWKGKNRPDAIEGNGVQLLPKYVEWPWSGALGEYIPSRWFELLSADARKPIELNLTESKVVFPLPLRFLPKPPHIYSHEYGQESIGVLSAKEKFRQARRWDYRLDVAVPGEEHDEVIFEISYERRPIQPRIFANGRSLFDCLVTFDGYSDSMLRGISLIRGWVPGTDEEKVRKACESLANFVADVANGFDNFKPSKVSLLEGDEAKYDSFASGKSGISSELSSEWGLAIGRMRRALNFCCRSSAGGAGREALIELTDVEDLKNGKPVTIAPSKPVVKIEPNPGNSGIAEYENQEAAFNGLSGLSGRRLSINGLDIFLHPVAAPRVQATRNKKLGGRDIAEAFWFETVPAKTLEKLVPRIHMTEGIEIGEAELTLEVHLQNLAEDLFSEADQPLTVDAIATLVIPFGSSSEAFGYPLGAMKGVRPRPNEDWKQLFQRWATRLRPEQKKNGKPLGIKFSVSVYAEEYAEGRPVLIFDDIWLPWSKIKITTLPSEIVVRSLPVEEPQTIAAAVYNLSRGLIPVRSKSSARSLSEIRARITWLIRSNVPSLNLLEVDILPTSDELVLSKLAESWRECVSLSHAAVEKPKGDKKPMPIAWGLAPWNQLDDAEVPMEIKERLPILSTEHRQFKIRRASDVLYASKVSDRDVLDGEVALFEIYSNDKNVQAPNTNKKGSTS